METPQPSVEFRPDMLTSSFNSSINFSLCEQVIDAVELTRSALYDQPDWVHLTVIVSYSIVSLLGALGNFLVILVVVRNRRMRTLRNYLIVNLAFSDFFMCTITVPFNLRFLSETYWDFGSVPCKIVASLLGANIFVSTLSTIVIGLDRYIVTLFPTSFKSLKFPGILCVWLLAMSLAIPMFFSHEAIEIAFPAAETLEYFDIFNATADLYLPDLCGFSIQVCGENANSNFPHNFRLIYTILCFFLVYFLPLCSLSFFYARIVWRLKQRLRQRSACRTVSRQRSHQLKMKHSQMAHLLVCLVAVYGVCWLPLMSYNILVTLNSKMYRLDIFAYCHITGMISACANPIIYGVFNKNFREHFEEMLVWLRNVTKCRQTTDRLERRSSPSLTGSNDIVIRNENGYADYGTQL